MTTTAAARNQGEPAADKAKAEKRRALGRGLESLLPGPRAVTNAAELRSAGQPGAAVPTQALAPAQAAGAATEQQVPHRLTPVRNDKEVEKVEQIEANAAELRSAGQPGAAVPTWPSSEAVSLKGSPAAGPWDDSDSEEPIELMGQAESRIPGNLVVNLAIADIDKNPFQTRYVKSGEQLDELTASVKANGVLQPIVVRPAREEGRYILIVGERRMRASTLAGKDHIPAIVRRVSEQQAAEMTIVENLQREDLSPLEQAEAFRVLSTEFKLTQAQIGERVGLSRESVSNYMRLLKLPREVMQLLAEKKISFAEARELLKLEDDQRIVEAALYAVKKGLTVEQIETLVMRMDGLLDAIPGMPGQEPKKSEARWVDPNVRAAQTELERTLGVKVRIRDRKGKGKIVIEYATVDDYDRVVGMLRGK